ncbi:4413_t:CDS:2 [Diversispora eburnea]|uniref:4413_t:CDS:1 n=1 Tax=Diversispora eburnea TaxID=1213867 RepID=A0A9N9BVW5_9GLOM|nr:4413_t:CDS:2 [Diversispora eburnea]
MQKQTITTQNTPSKEEMSSPLSENNFENSKQKFCINNSEQIDSRCDDTPTSEISDNSSNSDIYKESLTRCSTSPIYREVLSDAKTFSRSETPQEEKRLPLNHNENPNTPEMKIPYSEPKSTNLLPNQKIPYNQKVERGLRHELFVCITDNNSKGNKIVDIQIPEFSLETILTGSSKVTSQNIVDLFRVAMKVRQKESLCWYCYYKAYENRVSDVKSVNNIDVQSARTLVYNEIKSLLPDITDVNLRKITSRAKKVYILYEGIGIDKIGQVTYSASAISSLKDIQIQNIINDFSKKSTDMNRQAQSTISSEIKVIGVTNCHAHMSSSTDLSNTKRTCNTLAKEFFISITQ